MRMVTPIAKIAQTVEENPETSPDKITVAGPVCDCLAISRAGAWSPVAYSVRIKMTTARIMPTVEATASLASWVIRFESQKNPKIETPADSANDLSIEAIPCLISLLPLALTLKIPKVEVTTPRALTAKGNKTPGRDRKSVV